MENVDSFPYLFAGYTVIWAILAAYFLYLGRRISKLEKNGGR